MNINSPLELVHQFFVKLGARYVVVTDADGYCTLYLIVGLSVSSSRMVADEGIIDKNGWLAFLSELEAKG